MKASRRLPLPRLSVIIFLVILLPVFVWAVASQRIELRKKAAEPSVICWNRVHGTFPNLSWPNGCKGDPNPQACTEALINLTPDEALQYNTWAASGSAAIPGCAPTPTPTPSQYTVTPTPTYSIDNAPQCSQSSIPPQTGSAPLTVTLHGAGNAGSGVGFDGYRWDFENNGTWDTGISIDEITHMYTTPGVYHPIYQIHGVNNIWSSVCSYPYTITVLPPVTPTPSSQPECGYCNSNVSCSPGLICQTAPTPTPYCPNGSNGPCAMPMIATHPICVKPDGSSQCGIGVIPTPPQGCRYLPTACTDSIPPHCSYSLDCSPTHPPCIPLPPCAYEADSNGLRCTYQASPTGGGAWCPPPSPIPTCRPRPPCLDANPRCMIAETADMCPRPTPPPPRIPGDLNHDGTVNILDYNILLSNYGKNGVPGFVPADINRDGTVNLLDYNLLLNYYNGNNFGPD